MIVTAEQYADLQNHLIYAWLKWAQTHEIKITIAIQTTSGQEIYILGPHIKVYTDVITIDNQIVKLSDIVGLYDLHNKPLIETGNAHT